MQHQDCSFDGKHDFSRTGGGLSENIFCKPRVIGTIDDARRINSGGSSGKGERRDLDNRKILGVCPLDGMKWYIGITVILFREAHAASLP